MRTPSTHQVTDPTTHAISYLASADEHGESAREARDLGDRLLAEGSPRSARESHSLAGRFREEERYALQRAKVLAEIAQAQALDSIADSLSRIALAR